MITLYDFPLSGHCHRVRLFLSLIGLEYQRVELDLLNGEHKQKPYIDINPLGLVPSLIDDDFVLRDSNAILLYLAKKYAPDWYSDDVQTASTIQQWLAKEASQAPADARLVTVFGANKDHQAAIEQSHAVLKIYDAQLAENDWLAANKPTIADVSAYSYIAHAPEGKVDLDNYPNVLAWLHRVENLPNFVGMQKTPVAA